MNTIPVFDSLTSAIENLYGPNVSVQEKRYVPGGDANDAILIKLSSGDAVFKKCNHISREGFFAAEAEGLSAIRQTGAISTPKILARGCDREQGVAFLLMEVITGSRQIPGYWEVFASELCEMHRFDTSSFVKGGKFGFLSDNYIGAGEQCNSPKDTWRLFFAECRLEPQFRKAEHYFERDELRMISRLLDRLDDLLTEPAYPSLLHGDLWSGNFLTGNDGKAWLIDPAVYVGHAEADLAMTELFGGFAPAFYDAYREVSGLDPRYEDRRDLYNLYHLVNHLNLFGESYLSAVMRIVDRYV